MDWYKAMDAIYDQPGGEPKPMGTLHISPRFLKGLGALLLLIVVWHVGRLVTGNVSWFGYYETTVKDAPDWMQKPLSPSSWSEGLGGKLPIPAQVGQEIVVHYDLRPSSGSTARARIMVSCAFPCRNWKHFEVSGAGTGEFVVKVTDPDFYGMTIYQSAGSDGKAAMGTYWLGVRNAGDQ